VDHQVVLAEFPREITATFTMTGFTQECGRKLRAHGTEADLAFDEKTIVIRRFAGMNTERIEIGAEAGGHGGGDARMFREWLEAVRTRDLSRLVTSAQESLRTHAMVFAAETARRERRMVEMSEQDLP
jgi:hypothetical protein